MSTNFTPDKDSLHFVPLGGSAEIGMNLNLYHYKGKWLMIDLGIGFADEHLPGVEVVLPNIDFITERKKDLVGLVLTHAHEDHLGAVPYLWEELGCPVYATPFTAAFLRAKLAGMPFTSKVVINEVRPGSQLTVGPFDLEMIELTHSIPEMNALAIRTDLGTILHTGDWKLDGEPLVGPISDENRLVQYGKEGVLALVCDSTNVFVEGESGSEGDVRKELIKLVGECENRVVLATFASNVARLESIVEAAKANGRRVVLAGRSLWRMTQAAQESGYLQDAPPFLSDEEAKKLPRNQVLIIATGCQGESRAALTKIVNKEHPHIKLSPGDTCIFSSREIPGNGNKIAWIQNQLVLQGVEVITDRQRPIHVSGHPARDELARMYQMTQPRIAVPVHGEPRHLHEHVAFAKALQVPEAVEGENGMAIRLAPGKPEVVGQVKSGYIALDGNSMIPTDSSIIRDRRKLRNDGAVFVSFVVDRDGDLASPPQISTPGLLNEVEDSAIIDGLIDELSDVIERKGRKARDNEVKEAVRVAVRRFFGKELEKRPMISVQMARVKG
ncbi:MAG: ribonuclease J [Alphaproteobacteria bacterium]|nr:ribonuclease J [Alphaproteobacteria bacterium]